MLTVSEFSRQAILERYRVPEERVVVTYDAVDHERFRPVNEPPVELLEKYGLEQPFVLSVGRLEPRKNLERLLNAFSRVDGGHTLVLVGVTDFRYQSIVEAVGRSEGKVELLGAVSDDDLPGLYNLAEALAYPSLAEGFGMPVLEAMACGTPVLTTKRGALPEVGREAVLYVEPEDEEAIAAGITQIITDKALRSTLRERGLARAAEFRWEDTARRTLQAYHEAL